MYNQIAQHNKIRAMVERCSLRFPLSFSCLDCRANGLLDDGTTRSSSTLFLTDNLLPQQIRQ